MDESASRTGIRGWFRQNRLKGFVGVAFVVSWSVAAVVLVGIASESSDRQSDESLCLTAGAMTLMSLGALMFAWFHPEVWKLVKRLPAMPDMLTAKSVRWTFRGLAGAFAVASVLLWFNCLVFE